MKKENKTKTNAQRFIDAYNQIDYGLRVQHDFKRSMNFSDMIRKAVVVNYIIRKYEDDLIDYGRLRNAIIHRSNDEFIIAEPHDDVVEKIERIAKLVCTPPKALDTVCTKDVLSVDYDVSIIEVIKLIKKSNFSNLPVYKQGALIGVANGQKILNYLGEFLLTHKNEELIEFLTTTTIEKAIVNTDTINYFEVVDSQITIEQVLDLFQKNRKLLAVIITKTGQTKEIPLGIITSSDVMEMNNILENF